MFAMKMSEVMKLFCMPSPEGNNYQVKMKQVQIKQGRSMRRFNSKISHFDECNLPTLMSGA